MAVPTLYILNRNYSSWSLRAWFAIRTLSIPVNVIPLIVGNKEIPDIRTKESDIFLAQAGGSGKVPSLHVRKPNGETHVVFESLAILEFLAEDHPSLWPADKFERAYARSLASEMATGFGHLRNFCFIVKADYPFKVAEHLYTPAAEKDLLRITGVWEELRSKAVQNKETDKGFLFGHLTALDSMYSPIIFRIRSYKLQDKIPFPLAKAYIEHMFNTPALQEWTKAALAETEILPSCEMFPENPAQA
ncbi:hypothetical protein BG006_010001 [Podila minutissima]|uniref:GST N-terminal domain-containing protein n=1 Tax=Podila minutissima TaxID=64525 RepID=A0A9P5VIU8_9FUNG|nr:hypothetical protein BG006_010001 [Podila minutissima]